MFFKNKYSKLVKIMDGKSDNVLWLTLDKCILGQRTLLGIVYVPPESSRFSDISLFDSIENDIFNLSNHNGTKTPVCLGGDFNSWFGTMVDYIKYDDFVLNDMSICSNTNIQQLQNTCNLDSLGIQLDRKSHNNKTNNFGHRLIQMCKNLDIYIANGRVGNDRYLGRPTCKNNSIIDLFILSPELLPKISKFEIDEFDVMTSDIHNAVSMQFTVKSGNINYVDALLNDKDKNENHSHCTSNLNSNKPIWDATKKETFINSIDSKVIEKITRDIENYMKCSTNSVLALMIFL